jgi:hypothetical protein
MQLLYRSYCRLALRVHEVKRPDARQLTKQLRLD